MTKKILSKKCAYCSNLFNKNYSKSFNEWYN
ncbi:hypothetical protein LCGC14_3111650, partial [marine sediment metagenome]